MTQPQHEGAAFLFLGLSGILLCVWMVLND